jgi:hypothetical protein
MAETVKRKQTLTKTMAANVRFVLAGNAGKKPVEMAEIFREKFNPSHWPRFKLEKLFKGLIDDKVEIVETFDRGRPAGKKPTKVAKMKKASKAAATRMAKAQKAPKANKASTRHIAEMSVATRSVAVPYDMLERLHFVAGKRHLVFNVSAFGIQIAPEGPQPTAKE